MKIMLSFTCKKEKNNFRRWLDFLRHFYDTSFIVLSTLLKSLVSLLSTLPRRGTLNITKYKGRKEIRISRLCLEFSIWNYIPRGKKPSLWKV